MFSFFKKNKKETVPEWASFFTLKEYKKFIASIDSYFKAKNISYLLEDGSLKMDENELGFGLLGLSNIAQTCKSESLNLYSEIITSHFESIIASKEFEIEFKKIVSNLDQVKKYLGIRIYASEQIQAFPENTVAGKKLSEDIFAMLIFDLPYSVVSVSPIQIEEWNISTQELFEIAKNNIKLKYPSHITSEIAEDLPFFFAQGEHFFVPNIILELSERDDLIGSKGTLIGIPHRHAALIYPIESMEVTKAINFFIPTTFGMYNEGPGSLSPNIYWYRNGKFINLPYQVNDGALQFSPPKDFVTILEELTQ